MDNRDEHRLKQYQTGNSAKKALDYLGDWLKGKRDRYTREMLAASDQEAAIAIWQKLKLLDEFERTIRTDIQTGELVLKEMEEE